MRHRLALPRFRETYLLGWRGDRRAADLSGCNLTSSGLSGCRLTRSRLSRSAVGCRLGHLSLLHVPHCGELLTGGSLDFRRRIAERFDQLIRFFVGKRCGSRHVGAGRRGRFLLLRTGSRCARRSRLLIRRSLEPLRERGQQPVGGGRRWLNLRLQRTIRDGGSATGRANQGI
ncbi:pentapeptide repeat-containing protein [Rosistilla oblonga]|uniref:pentapeptide repeat-containing protein n=1 Tax=Rosistilla oblonga TaxID=2527990 RepID=UPI003A97F8EF